MTQEASGPLAGLKVLELGSTIAAPFAGRMFADFGAEVIKVEPPAGDPLRAIGRHVDGESLWWASLARNKEAIAINMKSEEGRALVRTMMGRADIVIENYRPGQMEKWGLGWEDIHKAFPRLIMIRISGFGQDGPYSNRAGFGIVGEALSGLRSMTGDPDRPPARVAVPLTDYLTGLYAVLGAMMALEARHRSGVGQCIDAALVESGFSLMESAVPVFEKLGEVIQRTGSALPGHVPNNLYETRDGAHIHIAAGNDNTFRDFAAAMGRPELADDPRFAKAPAREENRDELEARIVAWTRSMDLHPLYEHLLANRVSAAPVYTVADCFEDPHYAARSMIADAPHHALGSVKLPNVVPRLSETPGAVRHAGRALGANTRAVLARELGLDGASLDALEADGAVIAAEPPKEAAE